MKDISEFKAKKVTTGEIRTKKKSEIQKFFDVFISEDTENVKSYIIFDVLVPAVKKAILDVITNGADMLLYGETRKGSKVLYSGCYDKPIGRRNEPSRQDRRSYTFGDVIIKSRGEAEEVLTTMYEIMSTYGKVRVADMNELVGVTGEYTDNYYGWTNLSGATIERLRDGGYMIKMPKAIPLE